MRLQLPDGSSLLVPAEGITLGRGSPSCWVDPSLSRQQVQLSVLPDVPGVLKLSNLGMNAVLVESRVATEGSWELREVLDQGMETLVDGSSRFYLISRMDTTLVTLLPLLQSTGNDNLERPAKRPRQADEAQAGALAAGEQQQQQQQQQQVERDAAFQLLAVRELGAETAAHAAVGVRLREVVEAGVRLALVSNFMVDLPWLLSACPALLGVQQMVLVHGEHGEREAALRKSAVDAGIAAFTAHRPPLPIAYGTHHSKAFLLLYPAGLRVVVHTANLIYPDCNNKTQGLWHQDFPPKTSASPPTSDFEAALIDYLTALSLPPACAQAVLGAVRQHDFSGAGGCLVASVPGYHTGAALQRYGHMRVRALLAQEELAAEWLGAPVVAQCSSLGSLDDGWLLGEFGASLAAGRYPASQPSGTLPQLPRLAATQLQIVWPTVEEVRDSVEGWAAGYSIPGNQKNVSKPFLQRHWHRYSGEPVGRRRAMPHIKTYTRYIAQRVAWVLLTSHNLSKAAWGALQKGQRQLMVRSYELGVLLLPSSAAAAAAHPRRGFCCTPPTTLGGPGQGPPASQCPADSSSRCGTEGTISASCAAANVGRAGSSSASSSGGGGPTLPARPVEFVSWEHMQCADPAEQASPSSAARAAGNLRALLLAVPLPFPLPPVRYSTSDQPWMCDVQFPGLDSLGRPCGSPWQFYGLLDDD